MTARLRAELRLDRDRLVASYEVSNEGASPLWLLDDMFVLDSQDRALRTPTAFVVAEPEDGVTLRLVRGLLRPRAMVAFPHVPGARVVEPGQTLGGEGVVPLPLQAYHPQDGTWPLEATPSRAVVEIGVIEEPDPIFEMLPLAEGGELRVPTARTAMRSQRLLRSEPLELPKPAPEE